MGFNEVEGLSFLRVGVMSCGLGSNRDGSRIFGKFLLIFDVLNAMIEGSSVI